MRVVHVIFYYLTLPLILIGDSVFFILFFLLHLLDELFAFLGQVIRYINVSLEKRFHKKRTRHLPQYVSPSLWLKVRYFLVGVLFSFLFFFLPLSLYALLQSLPNPASLGLQQFPQTTKIYDRNHHLLYQLYANQNRTLVPLSQVPTLLQEATIAIEDKNFYKNPGFDFAAIIRAALSDITHGNFQGGSTITQQLIKSALLTSDVSFSRKAKEVILAFWTQHLYSKPQILEMYFNQVPYGGTAWGVEAASQTYFGQAVKDVDLAQAAFLAGLPQAPSDYSPFGSHPTLWKRRQKDVLQHMVTLGYINQRQMQQALAEKLVFRSQQIPLTAPHFVMYVRDLLVAKYGLPLVEKGGLSVTTSLDVDTQASAQKIVSEEVNQDGYLSLSNGAAVVANPQNGDILAMVGSSDYNNPQWGNVNIATSLRQPGSSIKVVTYAAALQSKAFTAASILSDNPISFPDGVNTYAPVNYDGRFHGNIPLRTALANSFNIPAVKTLNSIGIPTFINTGRAMGIESLKDPQNYGLSITLGSAEVTMLDMTTAYATLANMGRRVDLNPILKVTDYNGNILEEKTSVEEKKALDPGVAYILGDILADNNARALEFGINSPLLVPGHRVSVKTGTTDNKRDNWTMGYTPNYVVTVWVGNNDNTPMSQSLASGITGAAPIWHKIITSLLQNKKDTPISLPSDTIGKPCLGHTEYFIKGTETTALCNISLPTWTPTPPMP